jgi:hypothetical protein
MHFSVSRVGRGVLSLFVVFLVSTCYQVRAQQAPNWTRAISIGGSSADVGYAVKTDAAGNQYATGGFSSSAKFASKTLLSTGGTDIYVVKFNSQGDLRWLIQAGGAGDDVGNDIVLDQAGNIYVAGSFTDSATFPSADGSTKTVTGSGQTIFLAKYRPNGELSWVQTGVAQQDNEAFGVGVNPATGTTFITGRTQGDAVFSSSDGSQHIVPGTLDWHVFLVKYDVNGNFKWGQTNESSINSIAHKVAVDADNNAYVTGWLEGSTAFHSSNGKDLVLTGMSEPVQSGPDFPDDAFIVKYDQNGNAIWGNLLGGYKGIATDVAVGPNGRISITGFIGNLTGGTAAQLHTIATSQPPGANIDLGGGQLTNPYNKDVFVATYDSSGVLLNAQRIGGIKDDAASALAYDTKGDLYVTGVFEGTLEVDGQSLTGDAAFNLFLFKFSEPSSTPGANPSSPATLIWAKKADGAGTDFFENNAGMGVSNSGQVYVTGTYEGTATFDALAIQGGGLGDAFFAEVDDSCTGNNCQGGTNPDFSLSVSPFSQTVVQGSSISFKVTTNALNGFNAATSLRVSGLPTGATASFAPTSVTGSGSSIMSVSAGASTPAGSYVLTVKGTSGTLVHTATATLVVTASSGSSNVNFGSGFSASGMQFNGHAKLDGTKLLLTDTTSQNQAASAFFNALVNVQSFTTSFSFQLTNPAADGITFTIQNAGLTAIGSPGGGLGYGKLSTQTAAIAKSVAVKFDLFDNSGEGINSTGLYTNGVAPTVPATTLSGGVNLHSGDVFRVQMDYDGMRLTVTITDATTPGHTFTTSFPIDIPATVGGNTAFVGFTAGTGGQKAKQEILNWTYNVTSGFSLTLMEPGRGASSLPATGAVAQGGRTDYRAVVTPTNGFTGTVALSLSGVPAGLNPFFTTGSTITGSDFAVIAIDPIPANFPPGLYTFTVTGMSGSISHSATAELAIGKAVGGGINQSSGFSAQGLQVNGDAKLDGTRLQLTDSTSANQASSVFWKTPMNVQSFNTTFTFQLTNPNADGFTFTIQNYDVTALGSSGAGLGYGKFSSKTAFIPLSAAIKFDLSDNSGEGTNSTGLYTSLRGAEFGPQPTVPSTPLTGGINLHSGDVFQVHMGYDGKTLTMTIKDLTVPANTFTTSFPISIPNTVGSNFAFVGFTAGTGGQTAAQEILNWTYSTP